MSRKIVVVGSCNTDMVINMERLPLPGETLLGGKFFMNAGGKGANQAVAAARLGGKVSFVAKVGNDPFGVRAIDQYKAVASGANAHLLPEDIDRAKSVIEEGDILLMQLETPMETIEYAAQMAKRAGKKVILNPAPAQMLPESLLRNLYMLIANETEAEYISGTQITDMDSVARAADIICHKGVENVVITLGSKGAFIKERGAYHQVSALKVKAVDATAAGDTFCGAVCVALSEGRSITEAVEFANRAAAITVTRMGAQSSLPYRREVES